MKAGWRHSDKGGVSTGSVPESTHQTAPLQQDEPSRAGAGVVTSQYALTCSHTVQEEKGEEERSTTTTPNNPHASAKPKAKKKKKRKKEEVDEVPTDPTSTSSAPDHLRYNKYYRSDH